MKTNYFSRALSLILSMSMLIASLAVLGGISANASEMVDARLVNGGFDSDTDGWSMTDGTVESSSEFGSFNSAFRDGNVAKVTPGSSASWLYQGVALSKGTYTLKFNCYTTAAGYYFGVYNSSDFSDSTIIKPLRLSSKNHLGADTSDGHKYGNIVAGAYSGPGSANRSHEYVFTLDKDTTVYFAIRCNTSSTLALYVDNVSIVTEAVLPTELINGDFENGTAGWSVTEGSSVATFKTVNGKQSDAHEINITGNAGYFVTGDINTWLYQGVKLPAGKCTWQFHIDLYGTHNMVGAYTSKSGIGSATSLITADTFTAVNDYGVTSSNFKKDTNDYRIALGGGMSHYTVTYVFTLTEETEVYFAIRGNGGACQYIDNMTLELEKELDTIVYDFDDNGKFDDTFVVNPDNQQSNMKIQTVASGDEEHKNVLSLPKYDKTGYNKSARFYKLMEGLTVGETYKVSFDLKFVDYTANKANDWIALAGTTSVAERPLTISTGDILTYKDTIGNLCTLPAKFVSYTDNDNNYTFAPNTNGANAVIMWNGGTGWANYTMEFVAENDTYFFYLENYTAKTDLYLDNIKFEKSAENFSGAIDKSVIQDETVKSLLVIGNSFASDTFSQFQTVLDAGTENKLRVGKFGKGAQTADYFASIIENGVYGANFTYAEKGYDGDGTLADYTSFDEVLKFTNWDYVLVQAATVDYSDSYRSSVVKFVNALVNKGIEKSKIYLYVPWASRQDYLDRNNKIYDTTKTQIDALNTYVEELKNDENLNGCKIVSVYNEIYQFSRFVDNVHRGTYGVNDGLHINKLGQTALSMTLYHLFADVDLTDKENFKYSNLDFTDSNWSDNDGGTITQVQLDAMITIANGSTPSVKYGDSNYDGLIDIRDLVRIKKLIANEKYTIGGDIDKNDELNSVDLSSMRKLLLNGPDESVTPNSIKLED